MNSTRTPAELWDAFIAHLNDSDPLMFTEGKKKSQRAHTNFLGSIESYRKIYMEANSPQYYDWSL